MMLGNTKLLMWVQVWLRLKFPPQLAIVMPTDLSLVKLTETVEVGGARGLCFISEEEESLKLLKHSV